MSSVAKLYFCLILFAYNNISIARELNILVVGEGVAANCNAVRSGPVAGVFQVGKNGVELPAVDPLMWAACKGGSIWMRLGEDMIREHFATKIVLFPVALERARVLDWTDSVDHAALLQGAIHTANDRHITFDYALFQGGLSDDGMDPGLYRTQLRKLLKSISLNVKIKRWLIAQGPECLEANNLKIWLVHQDISRSHQINWFAGADFGKMTSADFDGACRFNATGQSAAAHLWLQAIRKSDIDDLEFQKESLLYYFK